MAEAKRKQAVQGKATGNRVSKKRKKLNTAALKLLGDNADQIADALYNGTINGDAPSVRMLVELAQHNVEAVKAIKVEPLRSWAEKLAAELEWPDEASEESAEVGVGSREPEAA